MNAQPVGLNTKSAAHDVLHAGKSARQQQTRCDAAAIAAAANFRQRDVPGAFNVSGMKLVQIAGKPCPLKRRRVRWVCRWVSGIPSTCR